MCISCMPDALKDDEMSELLHEYSDLNYLEKNEYLETRYVKKES